MTHFCAFANESCVRRFLRAEGSAAYLTVLPPDTSNRIAAKLAVASALASCAEAANPTVFFSGSSNSHAPKGVQLTPSGEKLASKMLP